MLRKLSLILCIFFLTQSLFALDFIRAAYRETYRNYDMSYTDSDYESESVRIGELGLNYTHVSWDGMYLSASLMLPGIYSRETDGIDTGISIYDVRDYSGLSLGVDTIFGFGGIMDGDILTSAGFGAHLNGTSIKTWNDEYIHKYNLGFGFAADMIFLISDALNLNIGGQIAWDFLTIAEEPSVTEYSTDSMGSWSWSIYAGTGWGYY